MMKLKDKCFRKEEKTEKVATVEISAEVPECPDGGYGWIICLAAAIIQFIVLGIHNNFGILYTYFMKDLNANPTDAGKLPLLFEETFNKLCNRASRLKKYFCGTQLKLREMHVAFSRFRLSLSFRFLAFFFCHSRIFSSSDDYRKEP